MPPVIKNNWHTLEREGTDPDTVIALDACESGNPEAYKLLVGVPCSECYVNDRYAATIVLASKSLKTIVIARSHLYPDGIYKGGREYCAHEPNGLYGTIGKPPPVEVYSYSELDRKTFRWSEKHQAYRSQGGQRLWIGVAENYRPPEA